MLSKEQKEELDALIEKADDLSTSVDNMMNEFEPGSNLSAEFYSALFYLNNGLKILEGIKATNK